jgi:hypothetical protein
MADDPKEKHNHTGQTPSDIPSDKLINPPKRKHTKKDSKSNFNTTGKDHNLGGTYTGR